MRGWIPVLFCSGLLACAIPHTPGELAERERPHNARVHIDLVGSMLAQQQYYAALAHIEEVSRDPRMRSPELQLLRAQTLHRIGRPADAASEFQQLLRGPFAGQAYHGLGRIAIASDLALAVRYFNAAQALRPTDPDLRNDLGYALMMAGRLAEARHHLATAAELAPGSLRAAHNLIISYLLDNDTAAATALAGQIGIEPSEFVALRREVTELRQVIRTRAHELQSNNSSSPE